VNDGSRCYEITHRTEYRYSDVVTSSYGRGHLTPRDTTRQRCRTYRLAIDPVPADQSTSRDVYGNISSYFHVTQRHRALTVVSTAVVEVDPPPAELVSQGPALEPWEAARPVGREGVLASEFTLDLMPPEITDALREYAAPSFARYRPLIEVVRDLNSRIFTDFTYRSGSTTVSTKVSDVLRAREGVCQDFARLAIACLRANGLAARYVSGYLATDPPPGRERVFGSDATHAWVAVWIPPRGNAGSPRTGANLFTGGAEQARGNWIGLDPTNDQLVDERYVVVGWGRDYADVPPLRGIIYTDAEHSVIDVSVDVTPVAGTELVGDGGRHA
jgi:transglutaminase-like putative cysteine protease